jgi:hypothetical protein
MAIKFALFPTLVLCLAACSQPGPAPAPSDKPPAASDGASTPTKAAEPQTAQADAAAQPAAPQTPSDATKTPAVAGNLAVAEPPKSSAPLQPADPPKPQFREVTLPAGTALSVRLTTPLASDTSNVEDNVRGTLTSPIVVAGLTAVLLAPTLSEPYVMRNNQVA